MSRHVGLGPSTDSILTTPETGDSLGLRVELNAGLSVESVCSAAGDTLLVSGEGEHGEWDLLCPLVKLLSRDESEGWGFVSTYWNRYIDTNLAGLDIALEATGSGARVGEDGNTVAVFVGVD